MLYVEADDTGGDGRKRGDGKGENEKDLNS